MEEITVAKVSKAWDTKPLNTGCLAELERIRNGTWKAEVERIREEYQRALQSGCDPKEAVDKLKKNLPGILWSGTFTRRANEGLIAHSGLLCADLDGINGDLEGVREKLKNSPHCLSVFRSPTGTGLKAVFRVPADSARHAASFRAVERHVREKTGCEIDQACKDVARLCFVSYDPDLWVNEQAVELEPLAKVELPAKPVNGTGASAGHLGSRKEIAERILGAIEWTSETEGLCECPGKLRHTTGNGERNCKVMLNGAPTIYCFHNSCRGIVNGVNHQLRSDIGRAEKSEMERVFGKDDAEPEKAAEPVRPLNIWRPSQFLAWEEPPNSHFILPAFLTRGELTTLIGQGGLGKSRLALWLAICQILKKIWCGLETGGDPQKWLFLGDENSVARLREDLRRMFSVLTEEEKELVDEYLRLPAFVDMGDCDVWLGDATTQERIELTLKQEVPGVIVADPLANFAPGDIAKPGDMKEAIRMLLNIIRHTAPKAAVLLLHHARTGRQNIAQGVGWDAANFASGGKPLFSAARCQMNLMPGKADDDRFLVLHCAKANNCQRFETKGIIFNTENFTYSTDAEFDTAAWQADVEGRARSGQSLCTVADVVGAVQDGYSTTKALVEHLGEAFQASKRTVERLISRAVEIDGIKQITRGKYILGHKAEKLLDK